jgi:hypothetical protein
MIRGELEEPSDRRAALVELARRVEESGPVSRRRRASRAIAQPRPDARDRLVAGGRRGDERLDREVRIGPPPLQVAAELPDQRVIAVGTESERCVAVEGQAAICDEGQRNRRVCRASALLVIVTSEEVAGPVLRLLDVRLVEWVNTKDRAGDRGRDLPADELGSEIDRVGDIDSNDRMARCADGVHEVVGRPDVGSL